MNWQNCNYIEMFLHILGTWILVAVWLQFEHTSVHYACDTQQVNVTKSHLMCRNLIDSALCNSFSELLSISGPKPTN